jgi:16S rRNA (guanine1516-N2)-methyltransferase
MVGEVGLPKEVALPDVELPNGFRWVAEAGRLGLTWEALPKAKPLVVDFTAGALGHRLRTGVSKHQLFAKAIGFKGKPWRVVDATAGLGGDAAMLAALGCEVTAVERSPIVHRLLADGLARAPDLRVRLVLGDACDFLAAESAESAGSMDAVYIDPMFPERGQSALSSKEMQILKALLGSAAAGEVPGLLRAALAARPARVVVKRPRQAPKTEPVSRWRHSYLGKAIRYDVYF